MRRHRLRGFVSGCAVVLTLLTGCNMNQPYQPTPSTDAAQANDELRKLPSLEETTTKLESALNSITAAASQRIPSIIWINGTNADSGTCPAPYDTSDGMSAYLPNRIAENVSVSEQDWKDLLAVAKDSAATIGATEVQTMKDEPRNHDVWFTGPAGVSLKFSYKGNMVVSGYTGCRLPQDKQSTVR
jgi:predicted LppA-like lipoprotein